MNWRLPMQAGNASGEPARIIDGSGKTVAMLPPHPERRANAGLIVAAPALRDATQRLLKRLGEPGAGTMRDMLEECDESGATADIFAALDAALAKAEAR